VNIRRLDPEKDLELYRETYEWDRSYPQWYQDAEKVARLDLEQFIEQAKERADIGIFLPEFVALISILRRAPKVFEGHIWAKRHTKIETLGWAAFNVRKSLERDLGMLAGYVWIVKRNAPIRKLCILAGLVPDGAEFVDGISHGKPITWIRCSYGKKEIDHDADPTAASAAKSSVKR